MASNTLPAGLVAPPASVERLFEFSLLGLVASGYLAVAGSGYLDLPTVALTAAALVLRLLLVVGVLRVQLSTLFINVAMLCSCSGFFGKEGVAVSLDEVECSATTACSVFTASDMKNSWQGQRAVALKNSEGNVCARGSKDAPDGSKAPEADRQRCRPCDSPHQLGEAPQHCRRLHQRRCLRLVIFREHVSSPLSGVGFLTSLFTESQNATTNHEGSTHVCGQ